MHFCLCVFSFNMQSLIYLYSFSFFLLHFNFYFSLFIYSSFLIFSFVNSHSHSDTISSHFNTKNRSFALWSPEIVPRYSSFVKKMPIACVEEQKILTAIQAFTLLNTLVKKLSYNFNFPFIHTILCRFLLSWHIHSPQILSNMQLTQFCFTFSLNFSRCILLVNIFFSIFTFGNKKLTKKKLHI